MLGARCWMLGAGCWIHIQHRKSHIQHIAFNIEHRASSIEHPKSYLYFLIAISDCLARVILSEAVLCFHLFSSSRKIWALRPNSFLNSCSTAPVLYHDLISNIPEVCSFRISRIKLFGSIKCLECDRSSQRWGWL